MTDRSAHPSGRAFRRSRQAPWSALAGLARAGLVVRTVDQGPPVAVTYELTDSAVALLPALQELADWARAHLSAPTVACP